MEPSDGVPTEDAVQALIDFLVSPLLPTKCFFSREPPSLDLQESVARQFHALVLLYNYYHRKQFPLLEFLDSKSFCKMASIIKPSLMPYMKVMCKPKEFPNSSEQFSILEKVIDESCGICTHLEISTDAESLRTWPVSKVAVLLVDQTLRFCFLEPCSITRGLWSLIEKGIDICVPSEKETVGDLPKGDDFVLQFAFEAIKEKTGFLEEELTILEKGSAYSFSKQKTVVQFYLMQYHGSSIDKLARLPIKDAINSLRGPLFHVDLTPTPVVEYFHLLPYASILSGWLSRQMTLDDLPSSLEHDENLDDNSYQEIRSSGSAHESYDGDNTSIVFARRRSKRLAEAQERNRHSNKCPKAQLSH